MFYFLGSGSKASDSCIVHSQATAFARLAESSVPKLGSLQSGAVAGNFVDEGLLNILPVSAESTGMLPNRQGNSIWSHYYLMSASSNDASS